MGHSVRSFRGNDPFDEWLEWAVGAAAKIHLKVELSKPRRGTEYLILVEDTKKDLERAVQHVVCLFANAGNASQSTLMTITSLYHMLVPDSCFSTQCTSTSLHVYMYLMYRRYQSGSGIDKCYCSWLCGAVRCGNLTLGTPDACNHRKGVQPTASIEATRYLLRTCMKGRKSERKAFVCGSRCPHIPQYRCY